MEGCEAPCSLSQVPPQAWRLKGEGAANWVFSLDDQHDQHSTTLAGKVLRVRKPRTAPHAQDAALEHAVWAPVPGPPPSTAAAAAAAAAQREQLYVQRVMAPLLGGQYVHQAQPAAATPAYLAAVLAANGLAPGGSTLAAAADAATGLVGPPAATHPAAGRAEYPTAPVAVLLPDATLLTPSIQCSSSGGTSDGSSGGGCEAAPQQQRSVGEGPVVCLELKPKCGFVGACSTVHPANRRLKRHRSRYQLHQLLKLSQGKVPAPSAYDPRNLFSGQPTRVRQALHALLDSPQNNLRLFVDGQPRPLLPEAVQRREAVERQQGRGAALQTSDPQRQQQGLQGREHDVPQQAEMGGSQADAGQQGQGLGDLLAELLPTLPASQLGAALVELLAAALDAEGVLQRLLGAQQQCPYDVEGVYQLYRRLAVGQAGGASATDGTVSCGGAGTGSAAAAATDGAAVTGTAAAVQGAEPRGATNRDSGAGEAAVASSSAGSPPDCGSSRHSSTAQAEADDHSAALRALLALPADEAYAVLRGYVVAATAKDCALMVAFQRQQQPAGHAAPSKGAAAGQPDQGTQAESNSSDGGGKRTGGGTSGPAQPQLHAALLQAQRGTAPGLLCLRPGRTHYLYRLSFVDLDMKPLSKIPAHHDLDQRILAAARAHLGSSSSSGDGACNAVDDHCGSGAVGGSYGLAAADPGD